MGAAGKRGPGNGIAIQIDTGGDRMHFIRPVIVGDGSIALIGAQHFADSNAA